MLARCPRCGAQAEIAAPAVATCGDGCGWSVPVSTRLGRDNRAEWYTAGPHRWIKAEVRPC